MARKNDLRPKVFAVLEQLGKATPARVYEALRVQGVTYAQVRSCMWNCQSEGKLVSSGQRGKRTGKGGAMEAEYWLATEEDHSPAMGAPAAYASVFHYGSRVAVTLNANGSAA